MIQKDTNETPTEVSKIDLRKNLCTALIMLGGVDFYNHPMSNEDLSAQVIRQIYFMVKDYNALRKDEKEFDRVLLRWLGVEM